MGHTMTCRTYSFCSHDDEDLSNGEVRMESLDHGVRRQDGRNVIQAMVMKRRISLIDAAQLQFEKFTARVKQRLWMESL